MRGVLGLHHVTAIGGAAQDVWDFYGGVLGLRLVKRTVNQDEPHTYHLFFADATGTPGTEVTFFPWPHLPPRRLGVGGAVEVALAIPPGSEGFWVDRLRAAGVPVGEWETRWGTPTLPFADPHGLPLALAVAAREATPWPASPVPPDLQIRGLHAVRLWVRDADPTHRLLVDVLGFEPVGDEAGWRRYAAGANASGHWLELQERPGEGRARWGVGAVHHVAWRVADDAHQETLQRALLAAGRRPTAPIDRFWFRSVYFTEPNGALFELATDGPGFARDEPPDRLGERLVLPPWLEPLRPTLEAELPPLRPPRPRP